MSARPRLALASGYLFRDTSGQALQHKGITDLYLTSASKKRGGTGVIQYGPQSKVEVTIKFEPEGYSFHDDCVNLDLNPDPEEMDDEFFELDDWLVLFMLRTDLHLGLDLYFRSSVVQPGARTSPKRVVNQ